MKQTENSILPEALVSIREAARQAISPIVSAAADVDESYVWYGDRTDAGRKLPEYYLVYFLLVDLLGFRDLGQDEKVAFSIPIRFEGKLYSIEHRKFGLGVFVPNPKAEESQAVRIVSLIRKGIEAAEPYFEWIAKKAIGTSKINVTNNSGWLYERYKYLSDLYRQAVEEAERRKDEVIKEASPDGTTTSYDRPSWGIRRNSEWLAVAAIDAFFSWTEHVFIHLAILNGKVKTGDEVAALATANWHDKFKRALNLNEPETKRLFDELVLIKNQSRNFLAHGSFGKNGEAFHFHSGAGAVPVVLKEAADRYGYSIRRPIGFSNEKSIKTIEEFITHLWSGAREPARIYIQESGLPLILTLACDGTYAAAMRSIDEMHDFVESMSRAWDNAANMDW